MSSHLGPCHRFTVTENPSDRHHYTYITAIDHTSSTFCKGHTEKRRAVNGATLLVGSRDPISTSLAQTCLTCTRHYSGSSSPFRALYRPCQLQQCLIRSLQKSLPTRPETLELVPVCKIMTFPDQSRPTSLLRCSQKNEPISLHFHPQPTTQRLLLDH